MFIFSYALRFKCDINFGDLDFLITETARRLSFVGPKEFRWTHERDTFHDWLLLFAQQKRNVWKVSKTRRQTCELWTRWRAHFASCVIFFLLISRFHAKSPQRENRGGNNVSQKQLLKSCSRCYLLLCTLCPDCIFCVGKSLESEPLGLDRLSQISQRTPFT